MRDRVGPLSFLNRVKRQLPHWADQTPDLPNLIHGLLQRASDGELTVRLRKQEMEQWRRELRRANRRSFHATAGAVLVVSAAVILGFDAQSGINLWHAPLPSWLLGGIGIGLILSAWPLDG